MSNDLIKAPTGRNLNRSQLAKLDRMASSPEREAVVTGWSEDMRGPFITLVDGTEKVLAATGFLRNRSTEMR